jgi:hypothetical protein
MARKKKDNEAPEQVSEATPVAEQAVATQPVPSANGTPENPPGEEVKNRPDKCFSCPVSGEGVIEVAVWGKEIQIEDRQVRVYSVTLHKSYKTELGDWKHTNYLRGAEIHVAQRLLERAEAFILDQRTDEEPSF